MRYFRILTFAIVLWMSAVFAVGAQEKEYTFAVVPQSSSTMIFSTWKPVLDWITEKTGVHFKLRTYQSIPMFETDILKGGPDFAYMNPYHQVLVENVGYSPLLRDKTDLVGILVVHKGGSIKSINDLNGKDIAFPAPNALAASLYMRALLSEKFHIHFNPVYVKTHGNVYRSVIFGKVSAGGGIASSLGKENADIKDQLSVLYETPGMASHPVSSNKRVPNAIREKVKKAFFAMTNDIQGQALLKNIQISAPVEADYEKDYLPLKKLKLGKYLMYETN